MRYSKVWDYSKIVLIASVLIAYLLPVITIFIAAIMHNEALADGISSFEYVQFNMLSWKDIKIRASSIFALNRAFAILINSFLLSLFVAVLLSCLTWVTAFFLTRKVGLLVQAIFWCSFLTYFTPPIVLISSLSMLWQGHSSDYILIKIFVSHCLFLYPLALTLSFGFWSQKSLALDRVAVLDGANFWQRMQAHFCKQDVLAMSIVALLVFMVSWSDIIFSRVLASPDRSKRLVVDYIFEQILNSQVVVELGRLSFFTTIVVAVSLIMSFIFAFIFSVRVIRSSKCYH